MQQSRLGDFTPEPVGAEMGMEQRDGKLERGSEVTRSRVSRRPRNYCGG